MKDGVGTRIRAGLRTAPPIEIDEDDLVAQSAEVSLQCPFSPRPPALSVADDDQRMRAQIFRKLSFLSRQSQRAVRNLSKGGFIGVSYLGCTIGHDRTRGSAATASPRCRLS